jgi:hydrogenase-4 component B
MLMALLALVAAMFALGVAGASSPRDHGGGAGRQAVYAGSALLALVTATLALLHLSTAGGGPALRADLPLGLPWLRAHFALDALSAYFLLVVNGVGAVISLYAVRYGRHESEPHRVLPFYGPFLAGMNLVLLADDGFVFLFAWETVSLTSWLMVLSSHRQPETSRAAYVYLVMALLGSLALFLAFGALAGLSGDYSFAAMRAAQLSPAWTALVAALALVGAGSKAGLAPLHAWLPLAHPAAPSHVSALLSAVMTKVAIYGLVRLTFDLVGATAWWWGGVLIAIGAVTAVMGVLHALLENDLKRLLAYSTIENIGVIVVALGLALVFRAGGWPPVAALALSAALLHVLNHALFKSLLFCGAGAVQVATGERDLERLGGLIHRMPATAVAFLIGAMAISALPPLNGFVSEWLIFQAILSAPSLPQWGLKFAVPVAGAMLALATALAAACFVKAFGIAFLGRARSVAAARADDVDPLMLGAMAILAAMCVAIGVAPGAIIALLDPVSGQLVSARLGAAGASWLWLAPSGDRRSAYSGLILLLAIAALVGFVVFIIHRFVTDRWRRAPAWDCGFPDADPATQYTAGSFAQPVRRVLGTALMQARESLDMPEPGDPRPARFAVSLRDLAWDWFYAPVAQGVDWLSERLNPVRFWSIRRYLSLMFAALVALLAAVALRQ